VAVPLAEGKEHLEGRRLDRLPGTFYRIVLTDPPSREDFLSNAARALLPRRNDPEVARVWDGISVYSTEAQARRRARGAPWLGPHIAELLIREGAMIRVERTTRSAGHYTVWGEPDMLLRCVIRVVAVASA